MKSRQLWLVLALGMLLVAFVACSSPSKSVVQPTGTPEPFPTVAAATPTTELQTTLTPRPNTVVPTIPAATPTVQEPVTSFVEDCMAECHQPSPEESFAAGAQPLPEDHRDRTTCLECHAQGKGTALPSTHLGRLDASCTLCHK